MYVDLSSTSWSSKELKLPWIPTTPHTRALIEVRMGETENDRHTLLLTIFNHLGQSVCRACFQERRGGRVEQWWVLESEPHLPTPTILGEDFPYDELANYLSASGAVDPLAAYLWAARMEEEMDELRPLIDSFYKRGYHEYSELPEDWLATASDAVRRLHCRAL